MCEKAAKGTCDPNAAVARGLTLEIIRCRATEFRAFAKILITSLRLGATCALQGSSWTALSWMKRGRPFPMTFAPSIKSLTTEKHVFNGHVRSMRAGVPLVLHAHLISWTPM